MDIRKELVGTTAGHALQDPTAVDAYVLGHSGDLQVAVWTYGATLVEVRTPDRSGRVDNVVIRLPDLRSYEDRSNSHYVGATIGRYARCIADAKFELDGTEFRLDRNAGRHHIHGGTFGFDRFVWKAKAEKESGYPTLRLSLERPDGDQGYPGAVGASVTYQVRESRLSLEFRATTTASTVVALCNHAFWNLAGTGTIDNHRLAINARRALMVDEELIPVGSPVEIHGTPFEYSSPRAIGSHRLDHCYVLDDPSWAAEVSDPRSGRVMRLRTDQPGLQVYSGDGFAPRRAGLCLQTGPWPNSPTHPDYPSSRLDPAETYRHVTTHEFSTR